MSISEVMDELLDIVRFVLSLAIFYWVLHKKALPWFVMRMAGGKQAMTKSFETQGLTLVEGRNEDFSVMGLLGLGGRGRLVSDSVFYRLEVIVRSVRAGELNVWLDLRPRSLWNTDWSGWNSYPVRAQGTIRCTGEFEFPEFEIHYRKPEIPFTVVNVLRRMFFPTPTLGFVPTTCALPGLPFSSFGDPSLDEEYDLYTTDASFGPNIAPILRAWREAAREEARAVFAKSGASHAMRHWRFAFHMHGSGTRFEISWPNVYAGLARAESSIEAARVFAAHFRRKSSSPNLDSQPGQGRI